MAVDNSYGSGKSRSAANSAARRRVAAGQMTKSKKGPAEKIKASRARMAASTLGQIAETIYGFALPVGKVKAAAAALRAAGKISQAAALDARLAAKFSGKLPATTSSGAYAPYGQAAREGLRRASSSVYPRAPKTTVTRGFGKVDPEGYAALQKKPDFLGQGAKQIARNIKKTPKKVSKAEMDRIATKGFTRSEIDEFTDFANKYYANQARLRAKFGKNK